MINNPSASKRRSVSRSLYNDEPYTERTSNYQSSLVEEAYGYRAEKRKLAASRKSNARGKRYQEQEK